MLRGVRAPSRCRGVTESPLAGLHLVTPSNFPAAAKKSLSAGEPPSQPAGTPPCPARDLFTPSPEGNFRVPPLFVSTGPQRFPVPGTRVAPPREPKPAQCPGHGPALRDPAAVLGSDAELWAICFPGSISEVQSAPATLEKHPTHHSHPPPFCPKSGFLSPFPPPFSGLCPCWYSRAPRSDIKSGPRVTPRGGGLGTAAGTKGSPLPRAAEGLIKTKAIKAAGGPLSPAQVTSPGSAPQLQPSPEEKFQRIVPAEQIKPFSQTRNQTRPGAALTWPQHGSGVAVNISRRRSGAERSPAPVCAARAPRSPPDIPRASRAASPAPTAHTQPGGGIRPGLG